LCYFYLVRTFQEVPWVEEASIDDSQNFKIAKSPEEFVLGKLVEDLQTAYKYARTKFDDPVENKGRITRNAVSSLLADIYLWQGEFAKCIDACDQVINDTEQGLKLVKGENVLLKVFGEGNSSESIFELQFDDDKNVNSIVRNYYGYLGDISGEWSFSPVLVTGLASPFNFQTTAGIESEEDIRLKDYLFPSIDKYYIFKYAGVSRDEFTSSISRYNYKSVTSNWIFYRLSDIMLMKAEALIELETDFNEALRLINITYMRSNAETPSGELQLTTYNSKYDMEKLVYRERQRELMFEGKRWFDLMRLARRANSTAPLLGYVMKKYSGTASAQAAKMAVMNALYWPILSSELDVNPELKQNPFYELEGESSH
jgi:starch-binding outer membrane protein, SusD/RagB family